jgi:predicted CopG family antitoxin
MARTTSLSDEAFEALRAEKREGESDSDVVLRLLREARTGGKDPFHFMESDLEMGFSREEFDRFRDKMREADQRLHPDPEDAGEE